MIWLFSIHFWKKCWFFLYSLLKNVVFLIIKIIRPIHDAHLCFRLYSIYSIYMFYKRKNGFVWHTLKWLNISWLTYISSSKKQKDINLLTNYFQFNIDFSFIEKVFSSLFNSLIVLIRIKVGANSALYIGVWFTIKWLIMHFVFKQKT